MINKMWLYTARKQKKKTMRMVQGKINKTGNKKFLIFLLTIFWNSKITYSNDPREKMQINNVRDNPIWNIDTSKWRNLAGSFGEKTWTKICLKSQITQELLNLDSKIKT